MRIVREIFPRASTYKTRRVHTRTYNVYARVCSKRVSVTAGTRYQSFGRTPVTRQTISGVAANRRSHRICTAIREFVRFFYVYL